MSLYLISAILAWLAAQLAKYAVNISTKKTVSRKRLLYLSGGMPSAHSATTMSMAAYIGLADGIGSGLFGVASLLAAVTMYDAMMVRRSVGEHGKIIEDLAKHTNFKSKIPSVVKGHNPLEVIAGAILGVAIGAVVFFATN